MINCIFMPILYVWKGCLHRGTYNQTTDIILYRVSIDTKKVCKIYLKQDILLKLYFRKHLRRNYSYIMKYYVSLKCHRIMLLSRKSIYFWSFLLGQTVMTCHESVMYGVGSNTSHRVYTLLIPLCHTCLHSSHIVRHIT